ncbi:hypothetical protein ACFQ9X_18030 [Catenulispora yoronensis]
MTVSSVDFPVDLATPDVQAVRRLLAAAAAPARPHELRGYDAARRAFERAGTTPVRRGAVVQLSRLIGVKVAAVAGALTVTGVAVAAEADVLPSPIQRVAHQVLGGVGVPEPEPEATTPTSAAGGASSSTARPSTPRPTGAAAPAGSTGKALPAPGRPTGTGAGAIPAPGTSTSADTAVDVLALCRVFAAQQAGTGGPLTGHDRHALATLAGGEEKIAEFCATALAAVPPEPTTPAADPAPDPSGSQPPSTAPSPSKDHKPAGATPTTPADSTSGGAGNGHGHTPNPSHTPHLGRR